MTEASASSAGIAAATVAGAFGGLPNPIATAMYALIAAVIGWAVTWILNSIKKRLGI